MDIDRGYALCVAMAVFQFEQTMSFVFVRCLDAATHTKMVLIWSRKKGKNGFFKVMEFMAFGSEIAVCGNPEKANSVDHILLN